MVLVDGIPLLQYNFLPSRASLSGNELFQIADGVIGITFDAYFLS